MSTMPPVFSPDSRYIFYVLQDYKNNKSIAFVSDTKTGEVKKRATYDYIGGVVFSDGGYSFAYIAGREGKQFVVVGDFTGKGEKEGIVYDSVSGLTFSPDEMYVAFFAEKEGKQFLMIADKELSKHKQAPGYDRIYHLMFSLDGRAIFYKAQAGQEVGWKVETVE